MYPQQFCAVDSPILFSAEGNVSSIKQRVSSTIPTREYYCRAWEYGYSTLKRIEYRVLYRTYPRIV